MNLLKKSIKTKNKNKNNVIHTTYNKIIEKKTSYIPEGIQIKALLTNLKQNWLVFVVGIACTYILSKTQSISYYVVIYSFFIASLFGYLIHVLAHKIPSMTKWILSHDNNNMLMRNTVVRAILIQISKIVDFHATTHHDSNINNSLVNMVKEFFNNLAMQAGILWLIKVILTNVSNSIIFMWGLIYTTNHIINYSFVKPITHQQHHVNASTNYGVDIYDIIFGTKYEWTNIEFGNHATINLVVLTGLFVFVYTQLN